MEDNIGRDTRKCPYCADQIPAAAVNCPHCQSSLEAIPSQSTGEAATARRACNDGSGKGLAIASLALGVLGLVCCCCGPLGSLLAIVFGFIARSRMKRSGNMDGAGMATAGIVLGFVGIALDMIAAAIGLALSFLESSGAGTLWSC